MDKSHNNHSGKSATNESNQIKKKPNLTIPIKITNRFQTNHKFLEQLTEKSPMCLVNDISRHHKLKQEYVLLRTVGPDHSKIFHGKYFKLLSISLKVICFNFYLKCFISCITIWQNGTIYRRRYFNQKCTT